MANRPSSEKQGTSVPEGKVVEAAPVEATPVEASAAEGKAPAQREHRASHADKLKFAGLIAFFAVMAIIMLLVWPYIHMLFEPDGLNELIGKVHEAGWAGVLILEAVQFLQIVVAFIPGEVVQIAAGMIYGPWIGALIIFIGCVISSSAIFAIVHKLGAPFVHDMVPQKYMGKFREFERSKKFESIVFLLFLIPGLPKDVFTYITPLSDMRFGKFVMITNFARIPGIVISTYAADGLLEGRLVESVIMFLALAVVAIVALVIYNKLSSKHAAKGSSHSEAPAAEASTDAEVRDEAHRS